MNPQQSSQKTDHDVDADGPIDSDKDSRSSDETDTESGSEDSDDEEIDEEEAEKLKGEMLTEMNDLEKQFVALREQLYYERLNRIEEKLTEVRAGKSPDYLQPLEELQENLRVRTEVAGIQKELKIANVNCVYEAEKVAAKQTFDMECRAIADYLKQDIEEKLRRLEEDRNSIDNEFWGTGGDSNFGKTKKKRFLGSSGGPYDQPQPQYMVRDQLNLPDRRRKPFSVSGPYVIYMLREHEIMEDCNIIRRALRSSSSYYY